MTTQRAQRSEAVPAESGQGHADHQAPMRPHAAGPQHAAAPAPPPPGPLIRAKLEVGGANDPVERAADLAADVAIRNLSTHRTGSSETTPVPVAPTTSASAIARSANESSAPGLTAPPAIEQTIAGRSGSGAPLDSAVMGPMEQAFGADFSDVRVHADTEAAGVSRALGAQAFTSGSDIYFASGAPSADAPGGERLLAHELAHVVQHQGSTDGPIRRKIGFEFEENQWESYMRADEPPPHVHDPTNIWDRPNVQHVDDQLAPLGVAAFGKKDKLHQGTGWALEADGPYAQGRMDIEVVTEPFDISPQGMNALLVALGEVEKVMGHLTSMPGPMPREADLGQFFEPDEHGLDNDEVLLSKGSRNVEFKAQVTHGVDLAKLPDMFRAFGTPEDETVDEASDRKGARDVMSPNLPLQQRILGAAPDQADVVVNQMQNIGYIADDADVGRLTGFVTFLLTYVQCLQVMPWDGLKVALPFLSRYNFATLIGTLPPDQVQVLSDERDVFVEIVEMTLERDGIINAKRSKSLTGDNPLMQFKGQQGIPAKKVAFYEMLEVLTTRDWIEGILDGVDRLMPDELVEVLDDRGEPTDEYAKSLKIFGRGHGATKNLVGVDANDDKAIMENRALDPNGQAVSMDGAKKLALRYFAYMSNLEKGRNRFPPTGE